MSIEDARKDIHAAILKLRQLCSERGLGNDHTWLKAQMFANDAASALDKVAPRIDALKSALEDALTLAERLSWTLADDSEAVALIADIRRRSTP